MPFSMENRFGPEYASLEDTAFIPKYKAACFCGTVQYEVSADPVDAKICHCLSCQKLHGAPMQWAAISATIIVFVMALTRWVIYAKKIYDLK